jgi:3-phenylpropionate/trans-cinnamate dioxygenase ferredoxin reductase subunit
VLNKAKAGKIMSMKVVVIGAGQAAIAFAAKLRELDANAQITLIGEEGSLPYQRPPLSKKYMTGEMTADRLLLRPEEWYAENNVECITTNKVGAIDTARKEVRFNGDTVPFDKLLIATGSTPRRLPDAIGGNLGNVFTLRDLADADAITEHMIEGNQALIIGGGYIGLEAAAVLAGKGMKVRVIEMAERILQRVAAKETSDFVREKHLSHGVEIAEGVSLIALEGTDGVVTCALFEQGPQLDVDMVLVGIGVLPNMDLAKQAGLACSNGIEVDRYTRTSHPDIHAAGDVACFEFPPDSEDRHHVRLESVQNAIDQAEAAAKIIAGGKEPYHPHPWFWSDQYEMKLQIAGLNMGYDQTVVRSGSREGGQSVWYFADGKFIAVDAINDSKAYMFGKKILEMGRTITPGQAGDAAFDLKELIRE